MSRVTLRSQALSDQTSDTEFREAVISDLQNINLEVGRRKVITLYGSDRLTIPTAGTLKVYATASLTTVGSDGSNYFTVRALRNNQDDTGITRDSSQGELTTGQEFFLGQFTQVGKGDVVSLQVVMTGLIYPILTSANVSLRCELGPFTLIR